jgi:hypothetical protein
MNTAYSQDSTCRNTVRASDGQLFPISARADASAGADLTDNGVMSSIVFTMRSEPGQVSCAGN